MKAGNPNDIIYKEVVIIGNGPSGIALSYMLSGNLPILTSDAHPDEMLSLRLKSSLNKCLVGQDLRYLSEGLEGRSTNPISLLLDALLHPYADVGLEIDPLVHFQKIGFEIDHVVLGKDPPGGSWHKMDPYILTLSLGSWMALPGLPFVSRDSGENRAFAYNVAKYYVQYVSEMKLSKYFINNVIVTNITPLKEPKEQEIQEPRLPLSEANQKSYPKKIPKKTCLISDAFNYFISKGHRKLKPARCCKRPRESFCANLSPSDRKMKEARSRDRSVSFCCDYDSCDSFSSDNLRTAHSLDLKSSARVPFRISKVLGEEEEVWEVEARNVESGETVTYRCKYLVLANGASDLPNRLDFSKTRRDPFWLFHDLRNLEDRLDQYIRDKGTEDIDPVLIIGAGLSAADAVIATRGRNVPVIHVFRNKSADPNKQLPENMYPEYHKVYQMMKDGGSTYPFYTAYPEYYLFDMDETSRSVTLASKSGETEKIRISFVAVLIGSRPDLSFLPDGYSLGVKKDLPIDCKTNTLNIDKMTHNIEGFDSLFAVGPLAGDNFVRFIPGGALAVLSELYRRRKHLLNFDT